jgi:hypothetical protein
MFFEGETQNMIAAVEAALIAEKTPLWNSVVDGFGNHAPGANVKKENCPHGTPCIQAEDGPHKCQGNDQKPKMFKSV